MRTLQTGLLLGPNVRDCELSRNKFLVPIRDKRSWWRRIWSRYEYSPSKTPALIIRTSTGLKIRNCTFPDGLEIVYTEEDRKHETELLGPIIEDCEFFGNSSSALIRDNA